MSKKIVKYKKPFNLNIGIVIFVIIFIYLLFNVFSYVTTTHVAVYEVGHGTMAENNIFRGLILRSEQVYPAAYSGSLNYYVRETSKVSYNNLVYSVDESGDVAQMIQEASRDASELDTENLETIENSILDFQYSYDGQAFYQVYNFKDNINSSLNEALSLYALNSISDYAENAQNNQTFHTVYSDAPGIVVYYTDGYENVTTESFTADMFDEAAYERMDIRKNTSVSAGAPAYKLIDSELWNIVIPISDKTANTLEEDNTLQIRFVSDEKKTYATYTITQKDGQNYLILSLKNSMIRYARERYIEVELLLAEESGLKIPNSSIVEKEFYTIPTSFFLKGGDSDKLGLLVERRDEDGKTLTEFVAPVIYYETENYYYVDSESVSAGDTLLMADSNSTYTVGNDTASLKGVYNVNKGYAVFKQIDILYQSEEYSIVEMGTAYGIALYDHIALDGTKIKENELIKHGSFVTVQDRFIQKNVSKWRKLC